MKLLSLGLIIVLAILCTAGCTVYRVDVTGYLDAGLSSSVLPGKKVFVFQNPHADNPLLEKEVASRIGKLLEQKGFNLSSEQDADYRLTFKYGMAKGPVETGSIRRSQTIQTYDPVTETTGYETVKTYEPYSVQYHTQSLSIRLFDARKSANAGKHAVVWAADTISEGESSDIRETLNYLLVATFEYFGQDTKKAVRVRLTPMDPRVKWLKEQ